MSPRYVAVTGVCGFIGRHVTQLLLDRGDMVYGVDSLTYAADPGLDWLERWRGYPNFRFVQRDIRELGRWPDVEAVIHLAAETHVDNSLTESARFIETNVAGTHHLLEMTVAKRQHGMPHFLHVSTDEVYGEVLEGKATADYPLRPRSPYAASKAAADMLVQAWGTTFDLPYTILRPVNTYGCSQYPEKFIPRSVRRLMLGQEIQVHGDGSQTRQWLSVTDCASAILFALDNHDRLPSILNVGGNTEAEIRYVAHRIACEMSPTVQDAYVRVQKGFSRPGCDMRYSVDDTPLREAGWQPVGDFWKDLPEIVEAERKQFRF